MKIEIGNYDLKMENDPYKNVFLFENVNPSVNEIMIDDIIINQETIDNIMDFQDNNISFIDYEDMKLTNKVQQEEMEELKEELETLKHGNKEALRSIDALKQWYDENVYNMDLEHLENSTFFDSIDEIKEWLKNE